MTNTLIARQRWIRQQTTTKRTTHTKTNTRHHEFLTDSLDEVYRSAERAYARCIPDPANPYYDDYAGRGVTFDFWTVLEAARYIRDTIGLQRPGYTLDRINNDEGYKPGNLRWGNRHTQENNTRRTIKIEAIYNSLAKLPSGTPAWSVAKHRMTERMFVYRIVKMGYDPLTAISSSPTQIEKHLANCFFQETTSPLKTATAFIKRKELTQQRAKALLERKALTSLSQDL